MLTMIQRYHIKYQSFHKGQSLRSIAKDTGHDFRTVKKYAEQTDFNLKTKPKKGRPSKLDPVKPIINKWLTEDMNRPVKQRHTAKQPDIAAGRHIKQLARRLFCQRQNKSQHNTESPGQQT